VTGFSGYRRKVVRRHFDTIACVYDETIGARREVYTRAVDECVVDLIGRYSDPMVLDVGCGTGSRWMHLRPRLPGCRVYGVDASASMATRARGRPLDGVSVASMTSIPHSDRRFDVVTCLFFVICYLASGRERRQAASELYRVLRPGGRLAVDAINVWHRGDGVGYRRRASLVAWDYARSVLDPRLDLGGKLYHGGDRASPLAGYHHAFSDRSLSRLLRSVGFLVERRVPIGYGTGVVQRLSSRGQLLHIAMRPAGRSQDCQPASDRRG
jgi:ubiquinone/menaquinone biosynthesis C-methylase UbiE